MKKLLCLLILIAMLLPTLAGCGSETVTTPNQAVTTTPETTLEPDSTTTPETKPETPVVTTATSPEVTLPEGERLVKESYTAVLNDEVWVGAGSDTSAYTLTGTGVEIYQEVNVKYKEYKRNYTILEDGVENTYTSTKASPVLRKLGVCGATITLDETAKTAEIRVIPIETVLLSSWKAVSAKEGAFIRFEFTTNIETDYAVTVTSKEGGSHSSALDKQDGILVSGADGKYTGIARCNVPYYAGKTLYINICIGDGYTVLASIPMIITPANYRTGFKLVYQGDWDVVKDESYFDRFTDLFQHTYPKLYARFALLGDEPKSIIFEADRNYTGVAYQSGGKVVINVNSLNTANGKIASLSHEVTHSVQMFGGKLNYSNTTTYVDPATGEKKTCGDWFTENLANYGRLRYCELSYLSPYMPDHNVSTNSSLWDWGYGQYASGGPMFMAWLDWYYPTTDKNGDGKITVDEYGALDLMVYTIKHTTTKLSDNPYDPTSPFNKALSTGTGGKFATVEEARLQYVEDCKSGKYTFTGFSDYKDNFITENLSGVPESEYITKKTLAPTAKSNPILAVAMTTGENLCLGARVSVGSTFGTGANGWANLIDGDLETRLQAQRGSEYYALTKVSCELVIDLGSEKTFDTYTLVSYAEKESYIAKSWEILVSSDGGNFTAVDSQTNNTQGTVSVTFEEVTARYVKIRLFEPSANSGVTRLCEFMLFDSKQ